MTDHIPPAPFAGIPLIAGPCSAESEEQTLRVAHALASIGVKAFRAGVWKPRTKPGGFEGRGQEALPWIREAGRQTGMKTFTEVASPAHLALALENGIDGVWIGARTSANPFAVQEIADFLSALPSSEKERLVVLVKNPINPDLELWIGALERIGGAGIRQLGAIHRGFSSYGPHIYRNHPRWAIPIELGRRMPGIPILCDPSHIAGKAELVGSVATQAVDMNFAGLMVEVHCDPTHALSDAAQQLTPDGLQELLLSLSRRDVDSGASDLSELRSRIDTIDDRLLRLLAERMEISREIGEFKRAHKIPVLQYHRYNSLMESRVADAAEMGLSPDFVRTIMAAVHEESVRQQL